jgi:hypothetical protein
MARFTLLLSALLLLGLSVVTHTRNAGVSTALTPPGLEAGFASRSLPTDAPDYTAVLQSYCVACHNDALLTGNLSLQHFDVAAADAAPETAERIIRKLAAGMMPPPGMPRPGGDTLRALRVELENRIDRAAGRRPNPGYRPFQRLNRPEYESSIRELLGLEVDAGAYLPLDTKSANFDNIADVQAPSALAVEGYIRAADQISRMAVGDPNAAPTSVTYRVAKTASQMEHVPGAPLGTRGGLSVIHTFPADGEYVFQVMLHPGPTGFLFGLTAQGEQIEVSVDGERAALLDIDRWMSEEDPEGMRISTEPIAVRAGPHRVSAAFIKRFEGSVDDLITPIDHTLADTQIGNGYGVTTLPHLRDMSLVGPYNVTGVSDTPTRRRIFTCRPLSEAEEAPCAREIIGRLATQAYRGPLAADEMNDLMAFYEAGSEKGFEEGIRTALHGILASPHFLFRIEEAAGDPGESVEISDLDLASRLSFFLWGLPPDGELLDVARRGKLDGGTLEAQVRRLLADDRAEGLATRFAAQWLRLQDLEKVHPDALNYPYYDNTLAEAMKRETELFFLHLVRENRPVLELLTADYTFVNERLARHYGISGVAGPEFRQVGYPDDRRRGLLGHGSILTLTSHADRTSPVLRGKWVMEVVLGTPPPPPPANVPDLNVTQGSVEGRMLTTRQRMEIHRANPTCNACHQFMDPIGLALDNFEVTGAWRIKENGAQLDTRGNLYDGTPVSTPAELRAALLVRPDPIVRNFTANLLAYALGRRVEWYDMPTVRRIVRDAAREDYAVSSFVLGVVKSDAFRRKMTAPVAASGN